MAGCYTAGRGRTQRGETGEDGPGHPSGGRRHSLVRTAAHERSAERPHADEPFKGAEWLRPAIRRAPTRGRATNRRIPSNAVFAGREILPIRSIVRRTIRSTRRRARASGSPGGGPGHPVPPIYRSANHPIRWTHHFESPRNPKPRPSSTIRSGGDRPARDQPPAQPEETSPWFRPGPWNRSAGGGFGFVPPLNLSDQWRGRFPNLPPVPPADFMGVGGRAGVSGHRRIISQWVRITEARDPRSRRIVEFHLFGNEFFRGWVENFLVNKGINRIAPVGKICDTQLRRVG